MAEHTIVSSTAAAAKLSGVIWIMKAGLTSLNITERIENIVIDEQMWCALCRQQRHPSLLRGFGLSPVAAGVSVEVSIEIKR